MNIIKRQTFFFLLTKQKGQKPAWIDLHAKAQRPRHIGLPVSAVKHKHSGEAAEEHPVGVGSHLHCYTGSQHHEHCGDKTHKGTLGASDSLEHRGKSVQQVINVPVERESQPWSKSSPSGELLLVRLACFPSMASRDW